MEMLEITKRLIGPVTPTGEHNGDQKRLENLGVMIDLVHGLLEEINLASDARNNHQASMKAIGKRAYDAMADFGIF